MSLKAFHIFFISCSIVLTGWIGFWQLNLFQQSREFLQLLTALVFLLGSLGLVGYLVWFLKKMKSAH